MKTTDSRRFIYDGRGNVVRNLDVEVATPDFTPLSMAGSFQGAQTSKDRGYVYNPTLDSKKEVDAWSRIELNRRSRFVYASGGGLIQRLVDGTARMICGTGLIPLPTPVRVKGREGKIREWVHRVRGLYMQRCGSAITFDKAQRRNVFQDQRLNKRCNIVDGDSAKILVRDEATGRLRRIRYEANQIGNGPGKAANRDGRWHDGIKCGDHNEMLAMRINATGDDGKITSVEIPAENVLHSMNDQRIHSVRGLTRFYPVANKVLDRGEILASLTKNIKTVSQVSYVIEQQAAAQKLAAGAPGTTLPARPIREVDLGNGKKVSFEQFLAGGEAWGLKPGQSFKTVQAANPSTNVAEYLRDMVRDTSWAIGIAPEISWNIIDAGGANMRFIQADLAQFIEVEQDDLIDQDLGPDYVAWLYDMIVAGEVEEIEGWECHVWIAPARLTVDFGRDGKLYIEELKRGIRTMQSMYGMRGEIAQQGIDDYLDERQYIIQGINDRTITVNGVSRPMTFEEAFPEIRQQAMTVDPNANADGGNGGQGDAVQQLQEATTKLLDVAHAIAFAREPKS